MKLKKVTYLSFVLLIGFLLSLSFNIAFSFYNNSSEAALSHKHQSVSNTDDGINISGNLNNTKATESENENDFEDAFTSQEFIIPLIFSFTPVEELYHHTIEQSEVSFAEANPIYISVRNFRI